MKLQDLEPESARLCLKIEKICRLRFNMERDSHLLLAVSGGADSLALALIFHILAPRIGVRLSVAHLDHQLRSDASKDASFVEAFCARHGLPLYAKSIDVRRQALEQKIGLEEAGRLARLETFEIIRQEIGARFILLAHHAGDLAEDILLRLTRGAGWPGLGGMAWQNGFVLRPLLHTDPRKLRSFLLDCGQPWREDASNNEFVFKRNRFRHVFMPLFRCENPAIEDSFRKIHTFAELDKDYWEAELCRFLERHPWQIERKNGALALELDRDSLKDLHAAMRLRLYHHALATLREQAGAKGQNRADALLALDSVFQSGVGGKEIQCGGGIIARHGREGVVFISSEKES